jgi:hypothetical protein
MTDPLYTTFQAQYAPTDYITIQTPIAQPLKTEHDVYHYILHHQTAQGHIYQHINEMCLTFGYPIILYHPLLRYPLILFPGTTDAEFEDMLEELITKCLHSDAVASLEALHL